MSLENRSSVINAVKTPLGFLVLGLLVVDGTLAGLAMKLPNYQGPLVWTVIVSVPILVIIVVVLAVLRPEALRGDRPWQEVYAKQFADDLYMALDGALNNLEPLERAEAWLTVVDVITSESQPDKQYFAFCSGVAARLKKKTDLAARVISTQGPIRQ